MAFTSSTLNNVAASMGNNNIWLYTTADAQATVTAANYFSTGETAVNYGLKTNDTMIIASSDVTFMCVATDTGGNITTAALGAFA